ncbi:MAG: V-type ATP synthase subunit F [Faecalibacterium sp.]|nr:V-type ATP synthase subunit F [Ruminococcus sp.]MCM1392073.1 V-type ATP synthase subunit F [Ruminococcus sp.]MCM1484998.1 V-type ATP synthase subunit F [Faecalibacterium sp.]
MYKIAAIGDKDSIYGFAAIGLEIFPTDDSKEAVRLLKKFDSEDYAVVYITESLAERISLEIDKYKEKVTPAIILIPGVSGNTGIGMLSVSKAVEQAVGSDILK